MLCSPSPAANPTLSVRALPRPLLRRQAPSSYEHQPQRRSEAHLCQQVQCSHSGGLKCYRVIFHNLLTRRLFTVCKRVPRCGTTPCEQAMIRQRDTSSDCKPKVTWAGLHGRGLRGGRVHAEMLQRYDECLQTHDRRRTRSNVFDNQWNSAISGIQQSLVVGFNSRS